MHKTNYEANSYSFQPAHWCQSAHLQTMWGSVFRPTPRVAVHRQRWETPDGDFIDVDRVNESKDAPVLIVWHGLESSSRSEQVLGLLKAAKELGWNGVGVNFRSCSGTPNRLARSYHAGETSDMEWIIKRVIENNPKSAVICAGISLGGNVLLKYLGQRALDLPAQVKAAVTISAPYDLAVSVHIMEKGISRIYMKRFVKILKSKVREKLKSFPDFVNQKELDKVKTLAEFDEVVTAPVHGFSSAVAYWRQSSSLGYLSMINRPTLLINAQDDPFYPADALPREVVALNPHLVAEFPETGGHAGFVSHTQPTYWAEDRAITFLQVHL